MNYKFIINIINRNIILFILSLRYFIINLNFTMKKITKIIILSQNILRKIQINILFKKKF